MQDWEQLIFFLSKLDVQKVVVNRNIYKIIEHLLPNIAKWIIFIPVDIETEILFYVNKNSFHSQSNTVKDRVSKKYAYPILVILMFAILIFVILMFAILMFVILIFKLLYLLSSRFLFAYLAFSCVSYPRVSYLHICYYNICCPHR